MHYSLEFSMDVSTNPLLVSPTARRGRQSTSANSSVNHPSSLPCGESGDSFIALFKHMTACDASLTATPPGVSLRAPAHICDMSYDEEVPAKPQSLKGHVLRPQPQPSDADMSGFALPPPSMPLDDRPRRHAADDDIQSFDSSAASQLSGASTPRHHPTLMPIAARHVDPTVDMAEPTSAATSLTDDSMAVLPPLTQMQQFPPAFPALVLDEAAATAAAVAPDAATMPTAAALPRRPVLRPAPAPCFDSMSSFALPPPLVSLDDSLDVGSVVSNDDPIVEVATPGSGSPQA